MSRIHEEVFHDLFEKFDILSMIWIIFIHGVDKMYVKRWLEEKIKGYLKIFPVVVVIGPRQSGKTTMVKKVFKEAQYINFDDVYTLYTARKDPKSVIPYHDIVILDEVQRLPDILLAIKEIVDNEQGRRFVITGSSNLLMMSKISETLAGRAAYVKLRPFTLGEVMGFHPTLDELVNGKIPDRKMDLDLFEVIKKGLFPRAFLMDEGWDEWYRMYMATYVEKDVRSLQNILDYTPFAAFVTSLMYNISEILNESEISRELGIPQNTISRYLSLLETLMIFERVPRYDSRGKGLKKRKKVYAVDTGLVCNVLRIEPEDPWKGKLFENLMYLQLVSQAEFFGYEIFYYRDNELEVDFLVKSDKGITLFEIKASENIGLIDIKKLINAFDRTKANYAYIVYMGKTIQRISNKIFIIPWFLL